MAKEAWASAAAVLGSAAIAIGCGAIGSTSEINAIKTLAPITQADLGAASAVFTHVRACLKG